MLINNFLIKSKRIINYNIFYIIKRLNNNFYQCECIKGNIICKKQDIIIQKNKIEIFDIKPCNECKNFIENKSKNNILKNEGYCALFKFKLNQKNNKYLDTINSRLYHELCAPCGKFFETKNRNNK